MTPVPPALAGTAASNGYPFTWLVTGQASNRPDLALYILGLETNAGRRPACSRPAWRSKVSHTKSPVSGTKAAFTGIPYPQAAPNLSPHGGSWA